MKNNIPQSPAAKINRHLFFRYGLILLVLWFGSLWSQMGVPFNQRDDQYTLLGLKRAKEAYEFARTDLERKKEMLQKNLISQQEYERAQNVFADAEVNYQQSILAVLFEKQYVTVANAIKFQRKDGRKYVKITLANSSGSTAEFKKLANIEDELFRALQPDKINDVYVSLLNDQNAIISQPYEAKIEELKYAEPVTLEFGLLQDLDAITVDIIYGNGSRRSPKIFLQKDATANRVIVQSEQFSQEAELGGKATFDLTLELFSGETNTFKLEVVNLPRQINRYFIDPANQARLSQFKFTGQTNTRRAALQVFLPDRPTAEVANDQTIPFYVLIIPQEKTEELGDLQSRIWSIDEIQNLNLGFVRLELVTRGVGKLLVRAPQLFHSIKPAEVVQMRIDMLNEGSRRLDNVEIKLDMPLNWKKQIEPQLIPALAIGEEKIVQLTFIPPEDVGVGRYEFRIRSSSFSENQAVNGEDKIVTVEIQPETNVWGTLILILLILGVIIGIVIFGIRLSRR